ncbi:hypothetical protein WDW89_02070 [Deltaproteobacteria bacterium TL4]
MRKQKVLNEGENDLHLHLYGCLDALTLWKLARSKANISWDFFKQEYEKQFSERPDMERIMNDSEESSLAQFQKIYLMQAPGCFSEFQARFNLIIAISNLKDLGEVAQLVRQIGLKHHAEGVRHAEYRMMFPPRYEKSFFNPFISTICEQLEWVEKETKGGFEGRFSLSLPRFDPADEIYQWLKDLMKVNATVSRITTSIDFCFFEEGFPPKLKKKFFHRVLEDNQEDPSKALAIVYHVGEAFQDKSLESAIRWVHEAAQYGVHRLGHAIALGINPQRYLNQVSEEKISERLDQIQYDLRHVRDFALLGFHVNTQQLKAEQLQLSQRLPEDLWTQSYTAERLQNCVLRQNFVMRALKALNVCVESCPTSNMRIGMLNTPQEHPLHRFIAANIPVVLASDDPGIFEVTLADEYQWFREHISSNPNLLEQLKNNTRTFRSEAISGRMNLKS